MMLHANKQGFCGADVRSLASPPLKLSRLPSRVQLRISPAKSGVRCMDERAPTASLTSLSIPQQWNTADGIVIVDHGSRRSQSNSMLNEFVELFKEKTGCANVEPAHMELASPSIEEAFTRCVQQGASRIIVAPYFLSPGRHWDKDIPALTAEAAKLHPNTTYIVTAPIGVHDLMVNIIQDRINHCLSQAAGKASECAMCIGTDRCRVMESS